MIPEMMDGISRAIYSEFGEGYEVYAKQDVSQGLETPCFFIRAAHHGLDKRIAGRYLLTALYMIRYFPKVDYDHYEIQGAAERLWACVELVDIGNGNYIRGGGMSHRTVDGVLQFSIAYKCFLTKEQAEEVMLEAEIKTDITGG